MPIRLPKDALFTSDGHWMHLPAIGTELDMNDPRYDMAFAETARTDTEPFLYRFGLLNESPRQSQDEVEAQLDGLRSMTSALVGAGMFHTVTPSAAAVLPEGIGTLRDATRLANAAMDQHGITMRFAAESRIASIRYDHDGSLVCWLWAQAMDFMMAGGRAVDTCDHCGTLYAQGNKRQSFCSTSCRTMAHRKARS